MNKKNFIQENPGFYERLGLWYFNRLACKDKAKGKVILPSNSDDELVRSVRKVTLFTVIVAFTIGAINAGSSVYTELYFKGESIYVKYGWVALVTLILTIIEFAVLFWVSIRAVFAISRITGHNQMIDNNEIIQSFTPNLLARAALEIPDPVTKLMGIDPLARVSKKKLFVVGTLYKIKIALSNVLAKLFLRRVAGKSILRISISYVSVIITGLWNAITCFRIVREARLRLFGNLIAKHIVEDIITDELNNQLSDKAKTGCLQVIGNSVVNAQRYHPNMIILLIRISEEFKIKDTEDLDNWETFLQTLSSVSKNEKNFLLDLLCVAAAFDGKVSKIEKEVLHQAFGEYTEIYFKRIYCLKNLMLKGRLHQAIRECNLDFEPG